MFVWVAGMTERQKDAGSFREIYPKGLLRGNMSVVARGIFCQFMSIGNFFFLAVSQVGLFQR